jgi:hypothetical protein
MHALLHDDRGQLTLKRLWPWHQLMALSQAARLDRALAEGANPEASAPMAARATQLTSTEFRRDLAAGLRRILVAAGEPALPAAAQAPLRAARPVRVPLRTTRISQSAPLLAELADQLLEPGPVPVRGVAMVTRLLADGSGPLYHQSARDDLSAVAARAVHALTR